MNNMINIAPRIGSDSIPIESNADQDSTEQGGMIQVVYSLDNTASKS